MRPETREIDVWWLDLDEAEPSGLGAVSAAERERSLAMSHPRASARRLVASAFLRAILTRYDGRPAIALPIVREIGGRPLLEGSHLRFSMSHAGPIGAVAIATDISVGIDLEPISAAPRIEEIADEYLPAALTRALRSTKGPDQDEGWVALWTEVEARAKMTGEGIGHLSPAEAARLFSLPAIVTRFAPRAGFLATLAYEGPPARLRTRWLASGKDAG